MTASSASRLAAMTALFEKFATVRAAEQTARRQQMADFLTFFDKRRSEVEARQPPRFSLFSILGATHDEVRHSAFLAWLFNTRSGHRQGSLFLRSFLRTCDANLDAVDTQHYEVITEYSGLESIVDIAVWARGRFLVYIENKVLSPEGQDQLNREYRDMRRAGAALGVPPCKQFAVFLTPRRRRATSGDSSVWISVSYPQVAQDFSISLDQVESDRVRYAVEDWISVALTLGGGL